MTITPPAPGDDEALIYEETHVHSVYESIASHFSSTRYKPWPVVDAFLRDLAPGSIGLDVGCGNGKYLNVNKDVFIVGSDRSSNLIALAAHNQTSQPNNDIRDSYHDAIVADSLSLPHADRTFDFAICIAVIHHLSSPARRIAAIRAVVATLKQGNPSAAAEPPQQQQSQTTSWFLSEAADSGSNANDKTTTAAAGSALPHTPTGSASPSTSADPSSNPNPSVGARSQGQGPGQALLFVWALEQQSSRRGWKAGDDQDVLVPWVLKSPRPQQTHNLCQATSTTQTPAHASLSSSSSVPTSASASAPPRDDQDQDQQQDNAKEGKEEQTVFNRYYHLYAAGELEAECSVAGAHVVRSGYDRDNWWVVVEPAGGSSDE